MLSIGRREPRLIAGAVCFALSGIAWAGGVADGVYGNLLIAAIAPMAPIEVVPPIPEPRQYIFHYAMQYSAYRDEAVAFNSSDFYAAPLTTNELFKRQAALPYPGYQHSLKIPTQSQSAQLSGHGFGTVASSTSLIDMFQLTDDGTSTPDHPRRRLSMMINDWRVSASARIPLTHPHDAGATVNVQRKF